MDPSLQSRIDAMCRRDTIFALVLLTLVWLAICWVMLSVLPLMPDTGMRSVIIIAGLAVCAFNTASIVAMVHHYRQDKHHIYGLDIRHLDRNRAAAGRNT